MKKTFCIQNDGNCITCSLVNYGRDCQNNPIEKPSRGTIATASGPIRVNKKSAFGKWLKGWKDGGGWTGAATIRKAFERAQGLKGTGVSWYMLGKLMASEQNFGRLLNQD